MGCQRLTYQTTEPLLKVVYRAEGTDKKSVQRFLRMDPMYDRYYGWSPYVYVLNNPIRRLDLYGFTDWDAVIKGTAVFIGGLGSTVGGIVATGTPTGFGQIGGAFLISTGVPAMGLGLGQIAAGIKDDGTAEKLPSGMLEIGGMAGDVIFGNENGNLRQTGSVLDILTNIAAGGLPKTLIEQTALGVQVISTVNNSVEVDNRSSQVNEPDSKTANDKTNVVNVLPVNHVEMNNDQQRNPLDDFFKQN